MQIALDQIDFLPTSFRANAEPDAAFVESINTQGVLQPVLLRPNGNRYEVVKGERRVRAARLAGLTQIPAHVEPNLVGHHAIVARLAATMARRALTTTEQWRALCTLTDQGMPADSAAVAVGIEPRTARQMERLGRLHPELLAEYERMDTSDDPDVRYYLPTWAELGAISACTHEEQIEAARACGYGTDLNWEDLAGALRRRRVRIPRAWAIFDTTQMEWTEDLFAEPGSDDQFTAADNEQFVSLQDAALTRLIAGSKGRMQRAEGWRLHSYRPGYKVDVWGKDKPSLPGKGDKRTVFVWMEEGGRESGRIHWALVTAAPAATGFDLDEANRELDTHMDDADPDPSDPDGDGEADDDEATTAPTLPPAAEDKLPLTKHGPALLAKARTEALRAALTSPDRRYSYDDLLALLVIALASGTVKVKASYHTYAHSVDMRDLAARLLAPDGTLRTDGEVDPGRVAQEALARMLCLPEPDEVGGYNQAAADSARIPLAIGAIVAADEHLPRLDTEAFLATVTGAELKAWAKAEGVKLTKVTEIRTRMAGRAESWRPTWALFAPGETKGQGA